MDPRLPLFRDDLDLCWRANAAGHRVLVVPAAVVRHAEAASSGLRPLAPAPHRLRRAERTHANYVLLAHAPGWALPWVWLRLLLGCLLRSAGLLLGKRLGDSLDELVCAGNLLTHPRAVVAARRERRTTRTQPARALRPLLGTRTARLRHVVDLGGRRLSRWAAQLGVEPSDAPRAIETGPSEIDDDFPSGSGVIRRLLVQPPVVLVLTLTGIALLADRALLHHGALVGGALLAAPAGASDLWSGYLQSWHQVGPGGSAPAGPWLAVLASLATALLGKAGAAVGVLVLLGVPLSGLSAYLCARPVVRHRWLRAWVAASYALLPPIVGAVASGRIGVVAVHVLLPLLARLLWRVLAGDPGYDGWRSVATAGLFAAVVVAFSPALWPVLVITMIVGLVVRWLASPPTAHRSVGRSALAAVLVAALPVALLVPWSLELLAHPSRSLLTPGLAVPGLVEGRLEIWQLLVARPGGPGMPAFVLVLPLAIAALVGLVRTDGAALARVGWALVVVAAVLGLLVARTSTRSWSGAVVGGWPGGLTSAVGLGLCLAAAIGARGSRAALRAMPFSWRQPGAAVLALLAALSTGALAVGWVVRGADGPLHREAGDLRPAFIAAEAQRAAAPRTLVVRTSTDAISYDLLRGEPVGLALADAHPSGDQRRRLDAVVADLVAGRGNEPAERLATYAVRYVAAPSPADPHLVAALDGTTGLSRLSVEGSTKLWRVVAETGRAVVLDPTAAAVAAAGKAPTTELFGAHPATVLPGFDAVRVPPGVNGRLLVIAEAADAGWRAELDGRRLTPARGWGWAQAWQLPSGGGRLTVSHDGGHRDSWLLAQAVLVGLTLVAAAPSARRRTRTDRGSDQ
jgi:hypothetical protein